jgi:hypothetical protein
MTTRLCEIILNTIDTILTPVGTPVVPIFGTFCLNSAPEMLQSGSGDAKTVTADSSQTYPNTSYCEFCTAAGIMAVALFIAVFLKWRSAASAKLRDTTDTLVRAEPASSSQLSARPSTILDIKHALLFLISVAAGIAFSERPRPEVNPTQVAESGFGSKFYHALRTLCIRIGLPAWKEPLHHVHTTHGTSWILVVTCGLLLLAASSNGGFFKKFLCRRASNGTFEQPVRHANEAPNADEQSRALLKEVSCLRTQLITAQDEKTKLCDDLAACEELLRRLEAEDTIMAREAEVRGIVHPAEEQKLSKELQLVREENRMNVQELARLVTEHAQCEEPKLIAQAALMASQHRVEDLEREVSSLTEDIERLRAELCSSERARDDFQAKYGDAVRIVSLARQTATELQVTLNRALARLEPDYIMSSSSFQSTVHFTDDPIPTSLHAGDTFFESSGSNKFNTLYTSDDQEYHAHGAGSTTTNLVHRITAAHDSEDQINTQGDSTADVVVQGTAPSEGSMAPYHRKLLSTTVEIEGKAFGAVLGEFHLL